MAAPKEYNLQLAKILAGFNADPLGHVMFSYPWTTDKSIQLVKLAPEYRSRFNSEYGPDRWACEFLDELGREIRKRRFDGRVPVSPIRFSTRSGHGIGKSTLVAWLIKFILDTRPFSKGTVMANSGDQLRTRTWSELGKWHDRSMTSHLFTYSNTRGNMSLAHKERPGEWACHGLTWRKEVAVAFQGQHSDNSTSFYIFDEASEIPTVFFENREGGCTGGEPMIFDFGNPTRNSGMFFECHQGRFRNRYITRKIDNRDVALTNKKELNEWIETWGVDSDFIRVKILGEFPAASSMQFISSAHAREAMAREIAQDRSAPLVIGVDVARFGDDETVIYPRIGMDARSFPPRRFRGLDTVQTAGRVIECIRDFEGLGFTFPAVFVDGGGVGGGVIDQLRHLGYHVTEVQFGSAPMDTSKFRYRGDEMWDRMREAISTRLVLPREDTPGGVAETLFAQLTQREFGYISGSQKIHLEPKAAMKSRLGGDAGSPDIADALALTFAQEVAPRDVFAVPGRVANMTLIDYDPLSVSL